MGREEESLSKGRKINVGSRKTKKLYWIRLNFPIRVRSYVQSLRIKDEKSLK